VKWFGFLGSRDGTDAIAKLTRAQPIPNIPSLAITPACGRTRIIRENPFEFPSLPELGGGIAGRGAGSNPAFVDGKK